jgi:hypothetical protein
VRRSVVAIILLGACGGGGGDEEAKKPATQTPAAPAPGGGAAAPGAGSGSGKPLATVRRVEDSPWSNCPVPKADVMHVRQPAQLRERRRLHVARKEGPADDDERPVRPLPGDAKQRVDVDGVSQ